MSLIYGIYVSMVQVLNINCLLCITTGRTKQVYKNSGEAFFTVTEGASRF